MKRLPCFSLVSVGVGLLFLAVGLRAQTPTSTLTLTPTPTLTLSGTVTLTPTPGPGSYSYTVYNAQQTPEATPFVVPGNTGNSLEIDYTVTSALAPQGVLVFQFPPDIAGVFPTPNPTPNSTPQVMNPASFYTQAEYQGDFSYALSGLYVSVTSNTTIPVGSVLEFTYGQGGTGGFAVPGSTTQTVECVGLAVNTQAPVAFNATGVGVVPAPAPILVWSATITLTPTISPTFTASATPSATPTITVSPTITSTFTLTPVGPVRAAIGFYTYPNPFDMRVQSCVTVRFPPTSEPVEITIFSLVGNPVCTVSASAIQNSMGVAQWCGTDDYGRYVPGGLYFVRLKTPSQTWVHKMTVFH